MQTGGVLNPTARKSQLIFTERHAEMNRQLRGASGADALEEVGIHRDATDLGKAPSIRCRCCPVRETHSYFLEALIGIA
jgi:hypothetical protein